MLHGVKAMAHRTFFEFFAGGGMARAGLGDAWTCLFANDFSPMKAATYAANWGVNDLVVKDVAHIGIEELPGCPDLVWASFPCQDLSLAGKCGGLGDSRSNLATRSGTFWPFWSLMCQLGQQGRLPGLVVLENVVGAITSRGGRDFQALCNALSDQGYRYGAVVIDARHFVPQSRPRLFFVAVAPGQEISPELVANGPLEDWHPQALRSAQTALSGAARNNWIWWRLPAPPVRKQKFADVVESHPSGCRWHSAEETGKLLGMMTPLHLAKIEAARAAGQRAIGAVYKRTRADHAGMKRQRAEVRFDDMAGCLRTPRGGSSRQLIVVVEGESVRSRLLSPREAARLMGLDDSYRLPGRYNDACFVAGDGVCVPVVRFIAGELLEPILAGRDGDRKAA